MDVAADSNKDTDAPEMDSNKDTVAAEMDVAADASHEADRDDTAEGLHSAGMGDTHSTNPPGQDPIHESATIST